MRLWGLGWQHGAGMGIKEGQAEEGEGVLPGIDLHMIKHELIDLNFVEHSL